MFKIEKKIDGLWTDRFYNGGENCSIESKEEIEEILNYNKKWFPSCEFRVREFLTCDYCGKETAEEFLIPYREMVFCIDCYLEEFIELEDLKTDCDSLKYGYIVKDEINDFLQEDHTVVEIHIFSKDCKRVLNKITMIEEKQWGMFEFLNDI